MGDARVWEQGCSWLQDLEDAITRRVPPPPEEPWQLETSQAVRALLKKRNWERPRARQSLMKEAHKFAEELGVSLPLEYPQPSCRSVSDPETEIKGPKVKEHLKKADMEKLKEKIKEEKWHGRFLQARWQDSELSQSGCFAWLRDWTCALTHTIAGVMEL